MHARQSGENPPAYRPTSLDFINRPNPVEPHAAPHKHPLDGSPARLESNTDQELLKLLLDKNGHYDVQRPPKRRRSEGGGVASSLDLPKLPVRKEPKRLRIPPTLSGLHQPPPDAGLLPSISVEGPRRVPDKAPEPLLLPAVNAAEAKSAAVHATDASPKVSEPKAGSDEAALTAKKDGAKAKRNKWTEDETACLLKGVARFGIGNWTKILNCTDFHFERRTPLDLKDRFRVCCPDDYKTKRKPKKSNTSPLAPARSVESDDVPAVDSGTSSTRPSHRKSSSQLLALGIEEPFTKTSRRKRTAYTLAEDEALLKGFGKYGNSWITIQQEKDLGLGHRTPTDLRDRLRTKYPEEYAKAGLTPRPDVFPKPPQRGKKDEAEDTRGGNAVVDGTKTKATTSAILTKRTEKPKETSVPNKENEESAKKAHLNLGMPHLPSSSLFRFDDVFFGAPFDDDNGDTERITLDRRILDWPFDGAGKTLIGALSTNAAAGIDLDPSATLNLPRPTASTSGAALCTGNSSTVGALQSGSNVLPSLAAITSGSFGDNDVGQFELPSLMSTFGAIEGDSLTGADPTRIGNLMSLDELLS